MIIAMSVVLNSEICRGNGAFLDPQYENIGILVRFLSSMIKLPVDG